VHECRKRHLALGGFCPPLRRELKAMDWSSTVGEGFDDKSRRLSHPSEGFSVE